jgi:hypothetical protein
MLLRGGDGMRPLKPARESMAHFPLETQASRDRYEEIPWPPPKSGGAPFSLLIVLGAERLEEPFTEDLRRDFFVAGQVLTNESDELAELDDGVVHKPELQRLEVLNHRPPFRVG